MSGKASDTLPQPEQEATVNDPGILTSPVLGLIVKLAIVLGSCCPEVAEPARIEKLEFVVLAAESTVFDPQFVQVPVRLVITPEVGV